MDIRTLASISGILGFIISIATFILTRVERKKNVIVKMYMGGYLELSDTSNIGGKPVIINPEGFLSKALGENQC